MPSLLRNVQKAQVRHFHIKDITILIYKWDIL
jgi:hypothetical protein